jgi:hypothetical protein
VNRIHAIELHERAECPAFLREAIVETLGIAHRWGHYYDSAGPVFSEFCRRSRARTILDLCSGTGEPVGSLVAALARTGSPLPKFLLSDLFPNLHAMQAVAERHAGVVEVVETSVDATCMPDGIACDACTIVAAFHHFRPEAARRILAECVRKQRAVFVLEPFNGKLLPYLATGPAMVAAALAGPLLTRSRPLLKALCTYVVPLIPWVGAWDGAVSALRIHRTADLLAMVAPLGERFEWHHEEVPFGRGGAASVFWGIPRERLS